MTASLTQRPPRPTPRELAHEMVAVAADLPRFATAPLYRHWHLRWNATAEEVAAPMPGDDVIDHPQYRATRAITIAAPPDAVWPWLVQVGCLKAGFYADDLLDNLGRPSARTILPELQELSVGQWVPMSPTPTDVTAFRVAGFETGRSLLWPGLPIAEPDRLKARSDAVAPRASQRPQRNIVGRIATTTADG